MAVTSKLKKGVDIPVFEWLRPTPITISGPCSITNGGKPNSRFLYYHATTTNGVFRYDTWSDGWNQLTSAPQSFATVGNSSYNDLQGYYGRAISAPSSTTLQCAVPRGRKTVGLKIKIISGTGAGQERTITAVSDPTVHDTFVVSSANTYLFVDSSKNYTLNQYRDYMMRIIGNTSTDIRKILYNTANTLVFADNRFSAVGLKWAYSLLPYNPVATAGSQTICNIESYVLTVDSAWTVNPDNTSQFVIQSGLLWNINVSVARFGFQVYDVLSDTWYQKNSPNGGLLAGNLATDCVLTCLNESGPGVLLSGAVGSSTDTSIAHSVAVMGTDQYSNYILRIKSGTGSGQDRLILSNDSSNINISRRWDTNPDNTSVFEIVGDNEKIYMTGNAGSTLFEYDSSNDCWSDRRILESGCPTNLCAVWAGYKFPIGITSITRVGTVATVTTPNPHGLKTGDTVTILGATDALYNASNTTITATGEFTFTYNMAGTPTASPAVATASQSTTVLVDPSKNWPVNFLQGKILSFTTTAFSQTGGLQTVYYHRIIASNTATTITFATGTAPTANTTMYLITDSRANGSMHYNTVAAGSTSSVINLGTSGLTTNVYAGRRIIVTDGSNWAEASISSNTTNSITLSAALGFTPAVGGFINVLPISPTGQGVCLEYLYNTSVLQKGRYLFGIRGGNTNHMFRYDIALASWEILNQIPNADLYSIGTMAAYDGEDRVYFHQTQSSRIHYYDFKDNNVYTHGILPYAMSTATIGSKLCISKTEDGIKFLYIPRHSATEFWRVMLWI
jgi:Fe-S cluster assembly iron-binding protein IscA